MSKPIVLLDCDGVLADFIGGVLPIINELLGTSHTPEDVTEFSFADALRLTPEQAAKVKRAIGTEPRLADRLLVYPGARDGVRRLREIADVHIVTSSWDSNETWEFDRKKWLRRNFDIGHHDITFTAEKHRVTGDVLVDDKTNTCDAWRTAWPTGVAVQWSTPHNRRDPWDGPCTNDWGHLIEIVKAVRQ